MPEHSRHLIEAYRNWLEGMRWSAVYTATVRGLKSATELRKLLSRWIAGYERKRLGPRWRQNPQCITRVAVLEPHQSGAWHVHGLLYQPLDDFSPAQRHELAGRLHALAGFTRVTPIGDLKGAVDYFVVHGMRLGSELDIFGPRP